MSLEAFLRCRAAVPLLLCVLTASAPAIAADPPPFGTEECAAHPWPIPFSTSQATLSPFAIQRLDAVAGAFRADPGPVLASARVDGQEDHAGQRLSAQRLAVVLKALEDRGLPAAALWGRDDGGRAGVVPNSAGEPEPQNRTVWIELPSEGSACTRRLADQRREWVMLHCLAGGHGDPVLCATNLKLLD